MTRVATIQVNFGPLLLRQLQKKGYLHSWQVLITNVMHGALVKQTPSVSKGGVYQKESPSWNLRSALELWPGLKPDKVLNPFQCIDLPVFAIYTLCHSQGVFENSAEDLLSVGNGEEPLIHLGYMVERRGFCFKMPVVFWSWVSWFCGLLHKRIRISVRNSCLFLFLTSSWLHR